MSLLRQNILKQIFVRGMASSSKIPDLTKVSIKKSLKPRFSLIFWKIKIIDSFLTSGSISSQARELCGTDRQRRFAIWVHDRQKQSPDRRRYSRLQYRLDEKRSWIVEISSAAKNDRRSFGDNEVLQFEKTRSLPARWKHGISWWLRPSFRRNSCLNEFDEQNWVHRRVLRDRHLPIRSSAGKLGERRSRERTLRAFGSWSQRQLSHRRQCFDECWRLEAVALWKFARISDRVTLPD